jgi:heme/copper-type cytochrome/quinol oxidase subunit 2
VDTIANVNAAETTITIDNNYEITANFEEIPSINWTLIYVIIAVAIVAGMVIFFLLRRRRRAV